ncbi:MAG: hypothetical protein IJJ73_09585 [Bacteroidaceae bacterium]|nr:hypothetical protein [Bacteroidaceae bacterium]
MSDEARYVYEEQLRLIAEDEACAVEAAHLSAALKRNDALRRYIREQEKNLLASSRKSSRAKDIVADNHMTPVVQINNNVTTTSTTANAPTYNQHGDGGQYVADNIFTIPNLKQ